MAVSSAQIRDLLMPGLYKAMGDYYEVPLAYAFTQKAVEDNQYEEDRAPREPHDEFAERFAAVVEERR